MMQGEQSLEAKVSQPRQDVLNAVGGMAFFGMGLGLMELYVYESAFVYAGACGIFCGIIGTHTYRSLKRVNKYLQQKGD